MNQKNTTEVHSPQLLRTCLVFALNFSDYLTSLYLSWLSCKRGQCYHTFFGVRIK